MTHSMAILQYLGRKHDLTPAEESQTVAADMLREELMDFKTKVTSYCYFPAHLAKVIERGCLISNF